MQPLVRTPSPYPTESLLGFTLRVSETNGYETPTHILDYAGITRREALSPFLPINRLSAVLGKEPDALLPIAYSARSDTGAIQFRILGHDLGQSTRVRTYRLSKPAFCPQCVAEKGYLEAHWDLELVTTCPHHACRLLESCPACGKKVGWHRPGLLKCECGHDWTDTKTCHADPAAVELQAIVVSKIQNRLLEKPLSFGMPIEHLQDLSLPALFGAIEIVGKFAAKCSDQVDASRYELVVKAANALANWPSNYERLIDSIVFNFGVVRLKFLLAAFASAGITEETGRFLRVPVRQRIAALPSLAGGRIPKRSQRTNSICTTKLSKQIRYNSVGQRHAAAFLGIPVKALAALRASGHYKVLNIPTPRSAYHVTDLENFRHEIIERVPTLPSAECMADNVFSLGYVLRYIHFGSSVAKGGLIASILEGHLIPLGRTGDRIQDIVLRKSDVAVFRDKTRFRVEGNTISLAEAATYLHCDPMVIPTLVREGLFQAIQVPAGIRLDETSVEEFGAKYISLAKLAKNIRTSSRKLQREISKRNIPLTNFERGYGRSAQAFVSVDYEERLSETLHQIKAASQRPLPPCAVLEQYLRGLKETGASLPRCGKKPNRQTIAKACGLDRGIFYGNAEAVRLLNLYDTEDRQRLNRFSHPLSQ